MISIVTVTEGFRYADSAMMRGGNPRQIIPPGEWTPIQFGDVAAGGFAHSVLVPSEPGIGLIAAHFRQGNLGVVFYPAVLLEPDVIEDVTHDEFVAEVRRRYDVTVQGAVTS